MKTRLLPLFIAFATLLLLSGNEYPCCFDENALLEQENNQIIAAQIHVFSGINWKEIEVEVDRLKEAGFNAIIFRSFQNRYDRFHAVSGLGKDDKKTGVYFETVYAPTIIDMLTPLSRLCKQKDMQLFAWMTTRTMDWLDIPHLKDSRFDPESRNIRRSDKYDLFNTEFREYLFNILGDLASKDIDGIILQDDFVVLTREGFSASALLKFKQEMKQSLEPLSQFIPGGNSEDGNIINDPDSKLFRTWSVFKAEFLTQTGERLVEYLKRRNRNLKIGMNLYYDTVFYPEKAIRWLGQDLNRIKNSSFDLILLMAYHKQIAEEVNISVTEAIEKLRSHTAELLQLFGERLLIKIQLVDWKSGQNLETEEIMRLSTIIPEGTHSIALAPVERNHDIFAIMNSLLNKTTLRGNEVR